MRHKYLFILSPPYSGSTVLWRLLQSSGAVSALPDEGQKLPELAAMMRDDPWNPERQFDWPQIHRSWHRHWDLERPILLEKSPPHLCRADQLARHFQPAWFLLLLRDPLATCEALHRRNGMGYGAAAERWLGWLRWHLHWRERLPRLHTLYYEDLADDPERCVATLARWLPELGDIDPWTEVRAHAVDGVHSRSLRNMNAQKLARMTADQREEVAAALRRHGTLLAQTPYRPG